MRVAYPPPLVPGHRIAVTAPSSGVETPLHRRLDLALAHLRAQGFVVEEGRCLRHEANSVSAPADERAAELMHFLCRDDIDATVPPWGGELALELLDRLDWNALARPRSKWLLGDSDTSMLLVALTLRLGWATAHGPCLMDLVPGQDDPLTRAAMPRCAHRPARRSRRGSRRRGNRAGPISPTCPTSPTTRASRPPGAASTVMRTPRSTAA